MDYIEAMAGSDTIATTNPRRPPKGGALMPIPKREAQTATKTAGLVDAAGSVGNLVRVRLTWPGDVNGDTPLAEFSLTIDQAFALFLDQKLVVDPREEPRKAKQPTARLRRAMKQTDKITEARYTSADELFDALDAAKS